MEKNLQAFLDMIAFSEGTYNIGYKGYNCLVGSTVKYPLLFGSYVDHPRIYNPKFDSTAAGRYQILKRWFDAYKSALKLPDFSPDSQDKIAIQMIKECRAFNDVLDGNFKDAILKCKSRWASFPGADYNQRENSYEVLKTAYINAGGSINEV